MVSALLEASTRALGLLEGWGAQEEAGVAAQRSGTWVCEKAFYCADKEVGSELIRGRKKSIRQRFYSVYTSRIKTTGVMQVLIYCVPTICLTITYLPPRRKRSNRKTLNLANV